MTGDHMKPEFLAMNPMHNIPTVKGKPSNEKFFLEQEFCVFCFCSFWGGFCPIDISYDNELKHFLPLLECFKKMETSSWMNQGLWLPTWSTSMARMIVCTQRHVQCVCHKTFTIICNFFRILKLEQEWTRNFTLIWESFTR